MKTIRRQSAKEMRIQFNKIVAELIAAAAPYFAVVVIVTVLLMIWMGIRAA